MNAPRRPTQRAISLRLTVRHAQMVVAILRRERKKRKRDHERSGFVPDPGRFDANLMRVAALDDMIGQLDEQLGGSDVRNV